MARVEVDFLYVARIFRANWINCFADAAAKSGEFPEIAAVQ
jgi:hypothetical protein